MTDYSQKEIRIFSGVLKLARQGADPSTLTARRIAEAAGMGKATIYDYFSSKEEIIAKALIYSAGRQARRFCRAVDAEVGFEKKMMKVYDSIIDSVKDGGSLFNIFISARNSGLSPVQSSCRGACPLEGALKEFVQVIKRVIDCGRESGVISLSRDRTYNDIVLSGNLFAVGKAAKEGKAGRRQIKQAAYTRLVKSLN